MSTHAVSAQVESTLHAEESVDAAAFVSVDELPQDVKNTPIKSKNAKFFIVIYCLFVISYLDKYRAF